MQQAQAHTSALAGAPSASAVAPTVAHPHDPVGGDAPPKQVAQAMERLGRAGRFIADIRLGADRLLEALFVSGDAPPYSVRQHVDRMERIIVKEDAAMRLHFQDLRALGRYQPPASPPATPHISPYIFTFYYILLTSPQNCFTTITNFLNIIFYHISAAMGGALGRAVGGLFHPKTPPRLGIIRLAFYTENSVAFY